VCPADGRNLQLLVVDDDTLFLGGLVRYGVQVGDHVLQVDDTHQAGHPVLETGDDAVLSLDPGQVRLLAA